MSACLLRTELPYDLTGTWGFGQKAQVRLPFTQTLWFITLMALLAGASFWWFFGGSAPEDQNKSVVSFAL